MSGSTRRFTEEPGGWRRAAGVGRTRFDGRAAHWAGRLTRKLGPALCWQAAALAAEERRDEGQWMETRQEGSLLVCLFVSKLLTRLP